MEIYVALLCW